MSSEIIPIRVPGFQDWGHGHLPTPDVGGELSYQADRFILVPNVPRIQGLCKPLDTTGGKKKEYT